MRHEYDFSKGVRGKYVFASGPYQPLLKRALQLWDGSDYPQLESIYTNLLGTVLYIKGGLK